MIDFSPFEQIVNYWYFFSCLRKISFNICMDAHDAEFVIMIRMSEVETLSPFNSR